MAGTETVSAQDSAIHISNEIPLWAAGAGDGNDQRGQPRASSQLSFLFPEGWVIESSSMAGIQKSGRP